MKPKYAAAIVTWHDAWIEPHEETDPEDIDHAPAIQVSVGFVIRRDETGITLAMEYNEDDDGRLRTVYFIPAATIISVQDLKA